MEHSFKLGSNEFCFSFEGNRHFEEMEARLATMGDEMAARAAEMDARMAEMDAEMAAMDAEFGELEDDDRRCADGHFHEEYFDQDSGEHVSSRSGSYSIGPLHVTYRSQTRRSHD